MTKSIATFEQDVTSIDHELISSVAARDLFTDQIVHAHARNAICLAHRRIHSIIIVISSSCITIIVRDY